MGGGAGVPSESTKEVPGDLEVVAFTNLRKGRSYLNTSWGYFGVSSLLWLYGTYGKILQLTIHAEVTVVFVQRKVRVLL